MVKIEKIPILQSHFIFGGPNNIYADCMYFIISVQLRFIEIF